MGKEQEQQLSTDEQAAQMADRLLKKSGAAGDMPTTQAKTEGGFTEDAGGTVITEQPGQQSTVAKGGKTGTAVTSEPGAQHQDPKTTAATTKEPKSDDGSGQPGEGGNLSQDGDAATRARKTGKVGGMGDGGAEAGKNLSEEQDEYMRGRKAGKVGISKAEAEAMGMTKAQIDALEEKGLIKAEEKEEDKEEEPEDKACKSEAMDADTLMKAMETLQSVAEGEQEPSEEDRRAHLAKRLEEGTLTKSEAEELYGALGEVLQKADPPAETPAETMETPAEDTLQKGESWQETFADDPQMEEDYSISPFLEKHSQLTAAALDQIEDRLSKSLTDSRDRANQFNVQLAKSLKAQAEVIKSQDDLLKSQAGVITELGDRLKVVEETPLPRKGFSGAQPLEKAFQGGAGGGESELTQDEILDTLCDMALKSEVAPCGEILTRAVALMEHENKISKSLHRDVVEFRKANPK